MRGTLSAKGKRTIRPDFFAPGREANSSQGAFDLYGLRFRSVFDRGDESLDDGEVPLVWEERPFPADRVNWISPRSTLVPRLGILGENYAYHFAGTADFLLPRDGSMLSVFASSQANPGLLSFFLYRGVIPRLLHLRGIPCLHASAVRVGEGIVGFFGPSGSGKSTLAAALAACGFSFVGDDVLPIRKSTGEKTIVAGPGLPEIRLDGQAAKSIGITDRLIGPGTGENKWRWFPGRIVAESLPLTHLYLLRPTRKGTQDAARVRTTSLRSKTQEFLSLLRHSHWVHSDQTQALASNLTHYGLLTRSVPIRRLSFPLTPDGFSAVEELIRREAGA